MNDILDIKPPLTLEFPWVPVALTAAGLALMLLGLWLWLRSRGRQPPAAAPEPARLSPYDLALELLKALDAEGLIEQDLVAEFYLRLTRIVRELFETVHGFPATGATSRELVRALGERRVGAQFVQQVEQFFQACDLVKFTSNRATRQEMREALEMARKLVAETRRQAGDGRGAAAARGEAYVATR